MCFKIPFKKYRKMRSISLVFLILSLAVGASAAENPGLLQDHALFWSLEKNGQRVGHLLGTIHSEDPRVLDFSENFLQRLRQNTVFAMEMVPDLPTLARLTDYMHLPKGQTLESVVGEDRFRALSAALSVYKVPADFVARMKPWAAMMTLSTPPPETGFFMDLSLSLRAAGSGLEVVGLETLEEQLSFLDNMPMTMQLSLLDQAIAEFEHVDNAHDEMVNAYMKNNLAMLQALSDEQLLSVGKDASDYFIGMGIRARNQRMATALASILKDNTVFIAVGALHLPGEDGLINLLREQGFELSPLSMPFRPSTADQ